MDMIFTSLTLAVFTLGGFIFLAQKLVGWRGIAQHKAKMDIGSSVLAFFLFAGTSTLGIVVAVMTGFLASIFTSWFGKAYEKAADAGKVEPLNKGKPFSFSGVSPVLAEPELTPQQRAENIARTQAALARVEKMLNNN